MNFKIFFLIAIAFSAIQAQSQQVIPLYKNVPNSLQDTTRERIDSISGGRLKVSRVIHPTLTAYLPEKSIATGVAVVICPGGGYSYLVINKEGTEVAEALAKKGIAAFVLKYRLPNAQITKDKTIGPLQDAQQALKLVRERAGEWNIDTSKIGIMGFSAGGHLASTAATHFNQVVIENERHTRLRPDFAILVYPVISFSDSLAHKGSRRNLLTDTLSKEQLILYSNEQQVNKLTPPVFLIHCQDDKVVPVGNALVFYEALVRNGVSSELHIYPKGGHGFALDNKRVPDKWLDRCVSWIAQLGK